MKLLSKSKICCIPLFFFIFAATINAQAVLKLDASGLLSSVEVSPSPGTGSFVEGSTFQVLIVIDTRGQSVNGIEVKISFDKNKLAVVSPSDSTSVIGVWVEPPSYDNSKGTINYVGVVPNGIKTQAGVVGTVTFKAKATGKAAVSVLSSSKILLNDGLGTEAALDLGRAQYDIVSKPPEGVEIYSETHPSQSTWYNNNYVVLSWTKDPGVEGFSYVLDNQPNTIPDNTVDTEDTSKVFDKLDDGLWYLHIKAMKNGVWGVPGHFLVKIDTTPPAGFTSEVNYLLTSAILVDRTLVSFFTTDNLSGIDHYEVGVIDKSQPSTISPEFVQTESPFQVPISSGGKFSVIVRAVDKAGNSRDESITIQKPFFITKFFEDNIVYILASIIIAGFLVMIIRYFFRRLREARYPHPFDKVGN